MENYKFLYKPVFYIFSLLFSSWLVIKIERLSPSDMGQFRSLFEEPVPHPASPSGSKDDLKELFSAYKTGRIDSIELEHQLKKFVVTPNEKDLGQNK